MKRHFLTLLSLMLVAVLAPGCTSTTNAVKKDANTVANAGKDAAGDMKKDVTDAAKDTADSAKKDATDTVTGAKDAAAGAAKDATDTGKAAVDNAKAATDGAATDATQKTGSLMDAAGAGAMALIKQLGANADAKEQKSAMDKLLSMGAKAVPPLMTALKGGDAATQINALSLLGQLGGKAAPAKAEVKKLADSKDKKVKAAAAAALKKIIE